MASDEYDESLNVPSLLDRRLGDINIDFLVAMQQLLEHQRNQLEEERARWAQ